MGRKRKTREARQRAASRTGFHSYLWIGIALALTAAITIIAMRNRNRTINTRPTSEVVEDDTVAPGGYGGSESCRRCHAEEFEAWGRSHHGMAERLPSTKLDLAAFQPPRTFDHGSQHTSVSRNQGVFAITSLKTKDHYATMPVARVIGQDPLRQFLANFPGGRFQTMEASYDPHRNEWFNVYGNEDRQPGEWGHWTGRGMNWNSMCAACHNTRLEKNYNPANDTYHTTMAERSVGCEACHGPLKAHNEWQERFGKSGQKDPTLPKFTRQQTMDNCGFCHSRRGDLTGDFKPGDNFFDRMRLSIVDSTPTFYPDGQVHDEDYEYTAFLGSRMHARGVWCMDCHDPHTAEIKQPGNALCLRCHNGGDQNAPIINPGTHSFHKVFGYDDKGKAIDANQLSARPAKIKESGGECVNCHMPQTVYMQRHWRHDHGFTTPDPLLTKQFGIPNACNRCHQDKSVDWAVEWTDKWYGAKMERPTRRRAQVIAAARNGEPKARDGLMTMLKSEEIPYWRAVAAAMLEQWTGDSVVRAALTMSMTDKSPLVRERSVRALQSLVASGSSDLEQAIRQRLNDPIRGVRIAAAWALRDRLDESSQAGRELLESMRIDSDQPAGQMQEATYAVARGHPEEAVAHYEKAVAWDPGSAAIHHDYAVVLSRLNHPQEAIAQLQEACRLEPKNELFQYELALAWNEAGDVGKTIAELQTAVRLDPQHARAWYNLGLALNTVGRTDDALQSLGRGEAADPSDPQIPYARATILARLGRMEDARQAAERALQIDPGYAPARELLQKIP